MAGALATLTIKDSSGNPQTMRVWDESGAGTGPFSFAQTLTNGDGATAPGSAVIGAVRRKTTIVSVVSAGFTITTGQAFYTIPASKVYRVKSMFGIFATSSTALTRKPVIQVIDGSSNIIWVSPTPISQTASQTLYYAASPNFPGTANNTSDNVVPMLLPDIALPAGFQIGFATPSTYGGGAGVSGDTWSGLGLIMEDES